MYNVHIHVMVSLYIIVVLQVISACVKSVEDHGYIMDYGIAGRTGFLLRKNAEAFVASCNGDRPLCVGQVVLCSALPGAHGRTGPVSVNPELVFGTLMASETVISLSSLLPGLLVNATVKNVGAHGISVGFLGSFVGHVSWRHLAKKEHKSEQYSVGKKVKARLLWVNTAEKKIGLTLQSEIVTGNGFSFEELAIGNIYHDARVIVLDQPNALLLSLENGAFGYAPIKLVYENKEEKFTKRFSEGSRHQCRIVNFNLLDGVAIVSLQQSVLDQPFMKYSDVPVGEVVDGEIERILDRGLLVTISDTIRGFCPPIHTSDLGLSHPNKKLKVGKKVKCRVLRVDPEGKRLLVTLKKSLVNSKLPPLTSYSDAVPGALYEGTVSGVKGFGIFVRFFGEVKGLVQKTELSASQIIPDPSKVFQLGQVVCCRVLKCEAAAEKLLLSLCHEDSSACQSSSTESAGQPLLAAGELVDDLSVTAVAADGITLQHPATKELAFLSMEMLSDYPAFCPVLLNYHSQSLAAALKEGKDYTLDQVVIVSGRSSQPAQASTKRTLMDAIKNRHIPSTFEELKVQSVDQHC